MAFNVLKKDTVFTYEAREDEAIHFPLQFTAYQLEEVFQLLLFVLRALSGQKELPHACIGSRSYSQLTHLMISFVNLRLKNTLLGLLSDEVGELSYE
jgi:hypothetical protein